MDFNAKIEYLVSRIAILIKIQLNVRGSWIGLRCSFSLANIRQIWTNFGINSIRARG